MTKKQEQIRRLIAQIDDLITHVTQQEETHSKQLKDVHPSFQKSAVNLIHYRALRMSDLSDLQKRLGNLGLSRLAKAEAHVLASLRANRQILEAYARNKKLRFLKNDLSPKESKRLLKSNAKSLLGGRSKGRRARIMVTMPSSAATDYQLVHDMVFWGMNCARINCAHDDPDTWKQIIDNVRRAADKLKRRVRICMDLAGPKIRTGSLAAGPKVRKYRPPKDERGRVIKPLKVWVGPAPKAALPHIPMSEAHLKTLQPDSYLFLRDARGKKRTVFLQERDGDGFFAEVPRTTYLESNLLLFQNKKMAGPFVQVGELPPLEHPLLLQPGDQLRLHRSAEPGETARYDEKGKCTALPHISCTSNEVFGQVQAGDPVLFDDGKIEGIISRTDDNEMMIDIKRTAPGGGKLRADKGINFPNSNLHIGGLTCKDRQDLEFIAAHADVVNFSFVNQVEDVRDLIRELDRLGAGDKIGIILKIETQRGFNNLTDILLEAMRVYPVGVMIARGDLAIETGWSNIGRVQEEILSLCRAAHIPDIWATQVLENLAKKGIPSRAEITDAAVAQRADCVMLNKGPYIRQAIRLLDTILVNQAPYQDKNTPMLPELRNVTFSIE